MCYTLPSFSQLTFGWIMSLRSVSWNAEFFCALHSKSIHYWSVHMYQIFFAASPWIFSKHTCLCFYILFYDIWYYRYLTVKRGRNPWHFYSRNLDWVALEWKVLNNWGSLKTGKWFGVTISNSTKYSKKSFFCIRVHGVSAVCVCGGGGGG